MENFGVHSSESDNVPRALHVSPQIWKINKAHKHRD